MVVGIERHDITAPAAAAAARQGDDSFDAFCRDVHPRVVGALGLFCNDRDLGRDLAQESLSRACRDWTALVLRAALQRLSRREREAIILRYFVDLSVAQTAVVMRCAEGTVRALTAKGVAALREVLDEDWRVDDV